jgi:hypothetical protein
MSQLSMWVEPDGDGVWRIWVSLQTDAFSGRGWSWGGPDSLHGFASKLAEYPLPADGAAAFQLGFNDLKGDDIVIAIRLSQVDGRGTIEVAAEVADQYDARCRVKLRFPTSYAEVARFVPQLRRLAAGDRSEAVLEGT